MILFLLAIILINSGGTMYLMHITEERGLGK